MSNARSITQQLHHNLTNEVMKCRVGTLYVVIIRGISGKVDSRCIQEVSWRGVSTRIATGKDSSYKFFWVGNSAGTSGVGIQIALGA